MLFLYGALQCSLSGDTFGMVRCLHCESVRARRFSGLSLPGFNLNSMAPQPIKSSLLWALSTVREARETGSLAHTWTLISWWRTDAFSVTAIEQLWKSLFGLTWVKFSVNWSCDTCSISACFPHWRTCRQLVCFLVLLQANFGYAAEMQEDTSMSFNPSCANKLKLLWLQPLVEVIDSTLTN